MYFNSTFFCVCANALFSLSVIADIMIMQPICFVNARIISVSHISCNNSIHCNSHSAVCVRLWLDCRINEVLSNGQKQIHTKSILLHDSLTHLLLWCVTLRFAVPYLLRHSFRNSLDQSQVRKGIDFDLFLHYTFLTLSRRLYLSHTRSISFPWHWKSQAIK